MNEPIPVVFDCNIYIQSLLSTRGAAHACWAAARDGRLIAIVTESILAEVARVTEYPSLRRKRSLTHFKVERFLSEIRRHVRIAREPPARFSLERDPDDAHYVNVALDNSCKWVVTRDRDLLDLMNLSDTSAEALKKLDPDLRVVDPEAMLDALLRQSTPE